MLNHRLALRPAQSAPTPPIEDDGLPHGASKYRQRIIRPREITVLWDYHSTMNPQCDRGILTKAAPNFRFYCQSEMDRPIRNG